jgi:membrane protease YdiL (CAAX protease family)
MYTIRNEFWRQILKIIGLLILIQILQLLLYLGGQQLITQTDAQTRTSLIYLMVIPVLGTGIWAVIRPSAKQLGLKWRELDKGSKTFTAVSGILIAILLVVSIFIFPDMLVVNLASVLAFPIFEELLFRGWIWSKLEPTLVEHQSGLITWITTTALFTIWHLGYVVTVTQNAGPSANPFEIMFFKLLVGGMVGVIAGLARWRTGSVLGAIFMHGLWNLFGR